MNFVSVRIITADIKRLVSFYEHVTGVPMTMYTPDFGELKTAAGTVAIASTQTLALFGGEIAAPAANRSVVVEFLAADVDAEYERLAQAIGASLVQAPTTMPWGNRSLLFRDPDSNLVNFFTPVSEAAKARFPGLCG